MVSFAHSNEQSVKDKFGVTDNETLILFEKFGEEKNIYTGPFSKESIRDFINTYRSPQDIDL